MVMRATICCGSAYQISHNYCFLHIYAPSHRYTGSLIQPLQHLGGSVTSQ